MLKIILVAMSALFTVAAHGRPSLLQATEIVLPGYQRASLEKDLPVRDLILDEGRLWMLGRHGLWQWDLTRPNKLTRIPLQKKTKGTMKLRHLGTDGVSLFVASADTLYQLSFDPRRILKYDLPFHEGRGLSLGFGGRGDDFWWLHTLGFMKIDRYGKALIPRLKGTGLEGGDLVAFKPKESRVFYARGRQLVRVDLGAKPKRQVLMKAKHAFRDLRLADGHLILHTDHTVLRVSEEGELLQAIPVEESRRLLAMDLNRSVHAYLFHDGLLEVYMPEIRQARRYRLPVGLEGTGGDSFNLRVSRGLAVLTLDGFPRAFRLAKEAR